MSGPTIFARAATGFWLSHGVLQITFEDTQLDVEAEGEPKPVKRVVAGRLSLPAANAGLFAVEMLAFLRKHGVKPPSMN